MPTRLRTATLWKAGVLIGVLGAMALLFSIGAWASGGSNPFRPGPPAAPSPSEALAPSGAEPITPTADGVWASGETTPTKPDPPAGPSPSGPLSPSGPEPITLTVHEDTAAVEILKNYKPLQDALEGNEYVIEAIGPLVGDGIKIGMAMHITFPVPQDITMRWPGHRYKGVNEGKAVYDKTGWVGTVPCVTEMHVQIDLHTNELLSLGPIACKPYKRGTSEIIGDAE